jgi:hypothetical protein
MLTSLKICLKISPEIEIGGLQSEASPGKSIRPYLKNKLKQQGLGVWLK